MACFSIRLLLSLSFICCTCDSFKSIIAINRVLRLYPRLGRANGSEIKLDAGAPDIISNDRPFFQRENAKSDRFAIKNFHHIEFYCGDATTTANRFMWGLGMPLVAKTDQSTGNMEHASYVLQSSDLRFVFTAPYGPQPLKGSSTSPIPGFNAEKANEFFKLHGLGVRAIGIEVVNAAHAYIECTSHGGVGVTPPVHCGSGCIFSEVAAYGDVVLRYISFDPAYTSEKTFTFMPGFEKISTNGKTKWPTSYGLERLDHAVGNVWNMNEVIERIQKMTGMHHFAEFDSDQVGTSESGLNSIVLASNNELVLLPVNEPVYNTPRKSQIQTYLEQNCGEGLQHLALKTEDIVKTLTLMKERSNFGGFSFLDSPGSVYYRDLSERIPELSEETIMQLEQLGVLADKDDQGILLQIFTKPCGDRPTFFIEIIQRIGCEELAEVPGEGTVKTQRGGCGGFGKGNFKALFKSIEDFEKKLGV